MQRAPWYLSIRWSSFKRVWLDPERCSPPWPVSPGSMLAALGLPRLLEKWSDRTAMLGGIGVMVVGLFAGSFVRWTHFLDGLCSCSVWVTSTACIPLAGCCGGPRKRDRPALFAAQFALSHACRLLFYPLAGWLGTRFGMTAAFVALGIAGALAVWVTTMVWPSQDPEVIEHEHSDSAARARPHVGCCSRWGSCAPCPCLCGG